MAFKIREATDREEGGVKFGDLEDGDWFLDADGDVCRRSEDEDAVAFMGDGVVYESVYPDPDSPVIPIDVEIVWRRKGT